VVSFVLPGFGESMPEASWEFAAERQGRQADLVALVGQVAGSQVAPPGLVFHYPVESPALVLD
jgi:hypothetical protein